MKAFINTFDFVGCRLDTYFFIGIVDLSFVSVGGIVDSFMDSLQFIFLSLLALNSFFAFSFREQQFFHLIFISKQLISFSKLLKELHSFDFNFKCYLEYFAIKEYFTINLIYLSLN